MIKVTDSTQTFRGKAIVKIDGVKSYEKFRNDLARVAHDIKKTIKYDRSLTEPSKIPQDVLVVNGTTNVTRRGKTIGIIISDSGDDETLLSALRKVFGQDKVLEWKSK